MLYVIVLLQSPLQNLKQAQKKQKKPAKHPWKKAYAFGWGDLLYIKDESASAASHERFMYRNMNPKHCLAASRPCAVVQVGEMLGEYGLFDPMTTEWLTLDVIQSSSRSKHFRERMHRADGQH